MQIKIEMSSNEIFLLASKIITTKLINVDSSHKVFEFSWEKICIPLSSSMNRLLFVLLLFIFISLSERKVSFQLNKWWEWLISLWNTKKRCHAKFSLTFIFLRFYKKKWIHSKHLGQSNTLPSVSHQIYHLEIPFHSHKKLM